MSTLLFSNCRKTLLPALLVVGGMVGYAQPKLAVVNNAADIGAVTMGDTAQVSYQLKNVGNKPLQLNRIKPGCGCTAVGAEKATIAPGETYTLRAAFNSAGLSGIVNRQIVVETNDVTAPQQLLQLHSYVMPVGDRKLQSQFKVSIPPAGLSTAMAQRGEIEVTLQYSGADTLLFDNVFSYCQCTAFQVGQSQVIPNKPFKMKVIYWPPNSGSRTEAIFITFGGHQPGVLRVDIPVKVTKA